MKKNEIKIKRYIENQYIDEEKNIQYIGYFYDIHFEYSGAYNEIKIMGGMGILARDLNITKTNFFSFLPWVKEKKYNPKIFHVQSSPYYKDYNIEKHYSWKGEISNLLLKKGYTPDKKILEKIFVDLSHKIEKMRVDIEKKIGIK